MNAGELIRAKRKEKKMTIQEVADHLGVSKMTVSKYERNQIQNLKRDKLISICNLLDINPLDIINGIAIGQTITIQCFLVRLNHLLSKTEGLNESEKQLIKDYAKLICNKGN